MFTASLDSVGGTLAEARAAADRAGRQLAAIGALTWHSPAGEAFAERSGQLARLLGQVSERLAATEAQLADARIELDLLEDQILQLDIAG